MAKKKSHSVLGYIFHYDHWIIVAMAFVLTFVLWLIFDALGLKNPYKKSVSSQSLNEMFQNYESSVEKLSVSDNVVVVDIGGKPGRAFIAQTLNAIDNIGPIAVGVDVIFVDPRDEESDSKLIQAVSAMAPRVVMAFARQDDTGEYLESFFVDSLDLKSGHVMLDVDENQVRSFSALKDGDTAFVARLNALWNEHYGIAEKFKLRDEPIPIDYNVDCAVIDADSVREYADAIRNHIVIVGDISSGTDMKSVPASPGFMAGAMIHARCLETLHSMEGYPYHVPMVWNLLIAFVLCYVMELLLCLIQTRLPNTRKPWLVFVKEWVKASYLTNVVLLPLLAIVTILMINATMHGRYYQLTFIFTAVVLVVEARNIYKAAITALRVKHNWAFLKNSLVPE